MKNLRYLFVETTLMAAAVLGAANFASASSPAAWAQHDKDVAAACRKASGLRDPQVQPAVVRFDDATGIDARPRPNTPTTGPVRYPLDNASAMSAPSAAGSAPRCAA